MSMRLSVSLLRSTRKFKIEPPLKSIPNSGGQLSESIAIEAAMANVTIWNRMLWSGNCTALLSQ